MRKWTIRFALMLAMLPAAARGGTLPENFKLGAFVPGDAWMFVHVVTNPEAAFIEEHWAKVAAAFQEQNILGDLQDLLFSTLGAGQGEEAQKMIGSATELIKGVDWKELTSKEFVFAQRFAPVSPQLAIPDYIFLFRGTEESAVKNAVALSKILQMAASLVPQLQLTPFEGQPHWRLAPLGVPIAVELFQKGDIIALTVGSNIHEQVQGLLAGKTEVQSIVDQSRFRQALMQVPSPEDGVEYFDIKKLMDDVRGMINMGFKQVPAGDEDAVKIKRIIDGALNHFDFMDFVIMTNETVGKRQLAHSVARLQSGKSDLPFVRAITNRKSFTDFAKYVPQNAGSFSLNTFIDLQVIYDGAIAFVEKEVPEGAEHIKQMKDQMAMIGFDPQRDVFSWFSGEMVSVSLPGAGAQGSGVLMLRIKDKEKAAATVNSALDKLAAMMKQQGQPLTIMAASGVKAEGFRTIQHPMLMMMGGLTPCIGFADEWMVIGTSVNAVNACLDTASGAAPNILKNERFNKEGLTAQGPVSCIAFTDQSNMGNELASVLASLGMASMFIPPTPEAEPVRKLLQIAMKFGPVVQKIDFFSSSASVSSFDGLTWKSEAATTYKGN